MAWFDELENEGPPFPPPSDSTPKAVEVQVEEVLPPPIIIEDEKELKQKFAVALLKYPDNAFRAATETLGATDIVKVRYASKHWIYDTVVLDFQKEFVKNAGLDKLNPTKGDIARKTLEYIETKQDALSPKEHLEYLRFYCELNNYIEKPTTAPSVQLNKINQKILVVPQFSNQTDFEKQLLKHQQDMLNDES